MEVGQGLSTLEPDHNDFATLDGPDPLNWRKRALQGCLAAMVEVESGMLV